MTRGEDLTLLIEAGRAVARSVTVVDGTAVTTDGPALWALMGALDRPKERRDKQELGQPEPGAAA